MRESNNINELDKPVENFGKIIFEQTIDTNIDIFEMGLDQFIEEGVIKDIPIISAGYSIGKTFFAIKDFMLTKKAIVFAQMIRNGNTENKKLEKHKQELSEKPKKLLKELEIILMYLDRHTKLLKSKILGNFYNAYIDNEIEFDWEDFELCAEITDNISLYDLKDLLNLYEKEYIKIGEGYNQVAMKRLRNVCLIDFFDGMAVNRGDVKEIIAMINEVGKAYVNIGLKNIPFDDEESFNF